MGQLVVASSDLLFVTARCLPNDSHSVTVAPRSHLIPHKGDMEWRARCGP
jgi:hypothetical protein